MAVGANETTLDGLIREVYEPAVREQLNQRNNLRNRMEQRTRSFRGDHVVVALHTGRNTGTGFRDRGDDLPDADAQDYDRMQVEKRRAYGTIRLDNGDVEAFQTGEGLQDGSTLDVLSAETNGLVKDMMVEENKAAAVGGQWRGLVHEQIDSTTSSAKLTKGSMDSDLGQDTVGYRGDFKIFKDVDGKGTSVTKTDETTWLPVELYRMDSYAEVDLDHSDTVIFVSGFDEANGTIELSTGSASNSSSGYDLTTITDGHPAVVKFLTSQPTDQNGDKVGANPKKNAIHFWKEPNGIIGNLCSKDHFGLDRSDGNLEVLQAVVRMQETGSGTQSGAKVSFERLQALQDIIFDNSDEEPDLLCINPRQRNRLMSVLTNTYEAQSRQSGNELSSPDGSDIRFGGTPFLPDRHVPNGMVFLIKGEHWIMYQVNEGKFQDKDGAVLSRVSGKDQFEAYWYHYMNYACVQPNAQGILTGLTLG